MLDAQGFQMAEILFLITADHHRWAKSAARKYGHGKSYWLELIALQQGRCAFSGIQLLFDAASGTAVAGGKGVHPIYAAVDHCAPGRDDLGHQIVSYDLNDLKGHLPLDCFKDLCATSSWQGLMAKWRVQAEQNNEDCEAFRAIRKGKSI
jgi:hypothetical protein